MRILVIDDKEETARGIAFRLIDMGHTAVFLTKSTTVPDTVYRFQPQIVFVDVGMAGMGRWKAAALLRARNLSMDT